MNGLGPYHQAILAAREAGLALSKQQGEALFELLAEYVTELEERVAKGLASGNQIRTAKEAKALLSAMWKDLQEKTAAAVTLSARSQAELHARATAQILLANGQAPLGTGVLQSLGGISTAAARAVIARPAFTAAFKRIEKVSTQQADRILTTGILRGSDPTEIARALRFHIAGADAFPADALKDLRKIGHGTLAAMGLEPTPENLRRIREKGGAIGRHARLITRTEIMNAEHEAGIRAAADSPVVEAVIWFLSNRHPEKDECDVLAEQDLFGLGPGHYDPRKVPARPHPRCLCGRRHKLRGVKEWGRPRGALAPLRLDLGKIGDDYALSPSRRKNLRSVLRVAGQQDLTPATAAQVKTFQVARSAEVQDAAIKFKNKKASTKHALKKKEKQAAAAAAQAVQQAQALEHANTVLQKAHAAKPSIAVLKELVSEAETSVAAAKSIGAAAAAQAAENALSIAKSKLLVKQAANKASSEKHAAKKKAAIPPPPPQAPATPPPTPPAPSEVIAQAKALAATQRAALTKPADAPENLSADIVLHQKTGEQGGSNPGGFYTGKDGVRRYVKFYEDPAQAHGEVLSNAIYRQLGLGAPKSGTFAHNGKVAFYSEILEDVEGTLDKVGLTTARAEAILDGFAADVLTANWDAVGMKYDNVVVLKGGGVARIDQGGTLLFRAKAGRKDKSVLNQITEWDYFTDAKNPSYKALFDAAKLQNAYELQERVLKQIDSIIALRDRHGGWGAMVGRYAPALAAADRQTIVSMLEARTKLLQAKQADVRGYAEQLRRAEEEGRKQAERLKALVGKPYPRTDADKAQVATFRTAIEGGLKQPTRNYIREKITSRTPGTSAEDLGYREEVEKVKLELLQDHLVKERGIPAATAQAMVTHYNGFYRAWQGSAESQGAAAIKWAATELHGLPTSFHNGFYDHDVKRQLEVRKEGEGVATASGRYKKEDILALFQAERNFSRAFGDALGIDQITVYRNVHSGFFLKWKVPPPKKGDVVVVEHNSVVGFRGTISGFDHPEYRFEVSEYTWDDTLRHFWTHANASFTRENEIWFFYRPVRHKVTKAPK